MATWNYKPKIHKRNPGVLCDMYPLTWSRCGYRVGIEDATDAWQEVTCKRCLRCKRKYELGATEGATRGDGL